MTEFEVLTQNVVGQSYQETKSMSLKEKHHVAAPIKRDSAECCFSRKAMRSEKRKCNTRGLQYCG